MKVGNGIKTLRLILAVLILSLVIFIFSMSLKNAEASSKDSSWVLGLLNSLLRALKIDYVLSHGFVRSLAHFLEFSLLSCLSYFFATTYRINVSLKLITPLCFTTLVAVFDEILQLFSDGRAFQLLDILTDVSGGFLGIILSHFIFIMVSLILKRKSEKKRELHNG